MDPSRLLLASKRIVLPLPRQLNFLGSLVSKTCKCDCDGFGASCSKGHASGGNCRLAINFSPQRDTPRAVDALAHFRALKESRQMSAFDRAMVHLLESLVAQDEYSVLRTEHSSPDLLSLS